MNEEPAVTLDENGDLAIPGEILAAAFGISIERLQRDLKRGTIRPMIGLSPDFTLVTIQHGHDAWRIRIDGEGRLVRDA